MLVTGRGTGGSWKIRGEQLGSAMGATVKPMASVDEVNNADLIWLVKKPCDSIEQRTGPAKLIWDCIDYWKQPQENAWTRDQVIKHILKEAKRLRVDYIVAATRAMADDLETPYFLRHHGRIYYNQNPIREHVKIVAYEGQAKFLGKWLNVIGRECERRKWVFMVNPPNLVDVDIVIAVRDYPHKGYATDHYKSNVKLQNAQNSGTPIICSRERGYIETSSGGEYFADTPIELEAAFDYLAPQAIRLAAAAVLRKQAYFALDAAAEVKKWQLGNC